MRIMFLPGGNSAEISSGETVLQAAEKAGVLINASCGGAVKCGKCRVRVLSGQTNTVTEAEQALLRESERTLGWRLACCTRAHTDLEVAVPGSHSGSARKKDMVRLPEGFAAAPAVSLRSVTVPKATVQDQRDSVSRLREALALPSLTLAPGMLQAVQTALDADRGRVTAVLRDNELLALYPGHGDVPCYGVAFDIGTTTVVGMLWDLVSGAPTGAAARTNYQSLSGADVISRIQFSLAEEGNLQLLQKRVLCCLSDILDELCLANGIDAKHVFDVSVVGNTTMSHLFLGVTPKPMSRTPFAPVFTEAQELRAAELGLPVHPRAAVHLLPNIAGHVGSDITAVMLAVGMDKLRGNHIAIDIGTNGEIVAARDGELLCCSTAAGPAFEGAGIRCGMRAANGAIERVEPENGDICVSTVGGFAPVGLCGSGLIDAVAVLLENGVVTPSGRMLTRTEALAAGVSPALAERILDEAGPAFLLAKREDGESILLTQQDIREVQLAKGAILAGIQTLLQELAISEGDLDSVLLAGAFGNYIRRESALRIGLLPPVAAEKIVPVGNAAGAGASMALLSAAERARADVLARRVRHVELSMNEVFQEFYIDAMRFH